MLLYGAFETQKRSQLKKEQHRMAIGKNKMVQEIHKKKSVCRYRLKCRGGEKDIS